MSDPAALPRGELRGESVLPGRRGAMGPGLPRVQLSAASAAGTSRCKGTGFSRGSLRAHELTSSACDVTPRNPSPPVGAGGCCTAPRAQTVSSSARLSLKRPAPPSARGSGARVPRDHAPSSLARDAPKPPLSGRSCICGRCVPRDHAPPSSSPRGGPPPKPFLLGAGGPMPCLLYTSPSPRDRTRSRMPSSA